MKTISFLFCLLLTILAHSQITFENRYTGQGGTDAKAIRQTLDSGYIVVGGQSQPTTMLTAMKLHQNGDTMWTMNFNNPPAFGFNVEQTLDSGYIICGYAFDPNSRAILLKLDKNGTEEWHQTYGGVGSSNWAQAIKQLPDSGYLCIGNEVFKTDKVGTVLWSQATASGNQGMSLIETSDGNFVYTQTGSSTSAGTVVTKMDADGNEIWSETISSIYTLNNCDNNIAETSDGGYIIAGSSTSSVEGKLVKLDSDRDVEWSTTFQEGTQGGATSVLESDSGGYLAAGFKVDGTGVHGYLHRTDVNGDMLWEKEYERGQAQSLLQAFDSGYAFAGYKENSSGDQKYFVVKIGGQNIINSIDDFDEITVNIYPTVTRGIINLNYQENEIHSMRIISLDGAILFEDQAKTQVNLSHLPNGVYLLQLDHDESVYKVIISK